MLSPLSALRRQQGYTLAAVDAMAIVAVVSWIILSATVFDTNLVWVIATTALMAALCVILRRQLQRAQWKLFALAALHSTSHALVTKKRSWFERDEECFEVTYYWELEDIAFTFKHRVDRATYDAHEVNVLACLHP